MSKTQLLSAQSGILVVNVVKGTLARKGARLEVRSLLTPDRASLTRR